MAQKKIGEDYFEELDVFFGGRRLFWNLKVLLGGLFLMKKLRRKIVILIFSSFWALKTLVWINHEARTGLLWIWIQ